MFENLELTFGQYSVVYNMLSLAIAAMVASFVFFILGRQQLTPKYRPAMVISALVVGIAAYHYWRIFNSWDAAFDMTAAGTYMSTGEPFNDAYRYVDWLLTVPLLVAELVAVLALSREKRGPLMGKLIIASALMIGLGYPGEVSSAAGAKVLWAVLSTIPFAYILYVLWGELSKAAADNDGHTKTLLRNTKLLLIGTWGFYPIAYALPLIWPTTGSGVVGLQVGYSIADIAAKCGYGLMIFAIAKAKMAAEGVAPDEAYLNRLGSAAGAAE